MKCDARTVEMTTGVTNFNLRSELIALVMAKLQKFNSVGVLNFYGVFIAGEGEV